MRCFRPAPLWTASVSVRFPFFSSSPEALGTINPTDYSAPLLLDCTFTISRGCQQWGPDESNIHGISFTLLPLSHAPPPLCQAPVWWGRLLTLAAPIDRQFCNDNPQTTTNAPPLALQFAPVIGDTTGEPSVVARKRLHNPNQFRPFHYRYCSLFGNIYRGFYINKWNYFKITYWIYLGSFGEKEVFLNTVENCHKTRAK